MRRGYTHTFKPKGKLDKRGSEHTDGYEQRYIYIHYHVKTPHPQQFDGTDNRLYTPLTPSPTPFYSNTTLLSLRYIYSHIHTYVHRYIHPTLTVPPLFPVPGTEPGRLLLNIRIGGRDGLSAAIYTALSSHRSKHTPDVVSLAMYRAPKVNMADTNSTSIKPSPPPSQHPSKHPHPRPTCPLLIPNPSPQQPSPPPPS